MDIEKWIVIAVLVLKTAKEIADTVEENLS